MLLVGPRGQRANVQEALFSDWFKRQGHIDKIIGKVLFELGKARGSAGARRFMTPTARCMACLPCIPASVGETGKSRFHVTVSVTVKFYDGPKINTKRDWQ